MQAIPDRDFCLPGGVEILEVKGGKIDTLSSLEERDCSPLPLEIIPPRKRAPISEAAEWVDEHSGRLPSCFFTNSFIFPGDPEAGESPRFVNYVIRRRP